MTFPQIGKTFRILPMNESTSTKRAILRNEIFNITTLNITINKYDLKVFPSFQTLVSLLVKWSGSHLPCGNEDKVRKYSLYLTALKAILCQWFATWCSTKSSLSWPTFSFDPTGGGGDCSTHTK